MAKATGKRAGKMVKRKPVSEAQQAQYDRLLATHPRIRRQGRNLLYTSVNGHMFTMFSTQAELGLRLPAKAREQFLEAFDTTLLETYGTVMKEYVRVPGSLLADTRALAPWLRRSYEYATSLKPKK